MNSRHQLSLFLAVVVLLPACSEGSRDEIGAESADELFHAARSGDIDTVRRLVDGGVPADVGNRYDERALAMAAAAGHQEIASYLLEQGAEPDNRETFFNGLAMEGALSGGHVAMAVLLLEHGASDREAALDHAVNNDEIELARAAVAAGPIHESVLAELGGLVSADAAEMVALLANAESRPDPAPPGLSPEQLEAFCGPFEGWSSDVSADVTLQDGRLAVSLDGGEAWFLDPVAEHLFRTPDGNVEVAFWGRAGTIESLFLTRGDEPRVNFRRSVAEPMGPEALTSAAVGSSDTTSAPTVNWPSFRGENASGIGDGVDSATSWNVQSGASVQWQTDIPGLGNSSPVVWGDRVFVTTAVAGDLRQELRTGMTGSGDPVDEQVEHRWRVLALDKPTGRILWDTEIGSGVPLTKRHFKASQASSTPVTDGRHLVVVFPTAGLACLDLDGQVVWKHDLGGLPTGPPGNPDLHWGFSSSPVIHDTRVILQVDIFGDPYLAAWNLSDGRKSWSTARDVVPSWATPSVLKGPAGDELVVNASTIHGYDPATGKELWSLAPNSEIVIATPVVGDGVVYVSAGYAPIKPIYAIRAGLRTSLEVDSRAGDDALLWSHGRGGAYMPTPLLYRGILYVVHHNGRLVAYDAMTGVAIYKTRFSQGGTFTGSPVAVNGKLYIPTEEGLLYVVEAGPEFRELAVNDFDEPLMATPAVSEGVLLVRTPTKLVAVAPAE